MNRKRHLQYTISWKSEDTLNAVSNIQQPEFNNFSRPS
ncbi:hypothetical protein ACCUM_3820 [Candidatus Accumulibacter phosphatis]|uniref:Uncharacterized protein n=1 Tax=Candidatus Accumulibacter phosphatis TaxID=327160 RepID=A0A5S4EH62_9PROT|nr:hypothetical protein ACCUM_3820 [Candidatus Accumulibacter phosphatis]